MTELYICPSNYIISSFLGAKVKQLHEEIFSTKGDKGEIKKTKTGSYCVALGQQPQTTCTIQLQKYTLNASAPQLYLPPCLATELRVQRVQLVVSNTVTVSYSKLCIRSNCWSTLPPSLDWNVLTNAGWYFL